MLDRLSVRASLWLAFAAMLVGAVVIGVFSLVQMGGLNHASKVLYEQAYQAGQATEQVRSSLLRASRAQTQLLTATTAKERDTLGAQIESALTHVADRLKFIEAASHDDEAREKVEALTKAIQPWAKALKEYVDLVKAQPIDLMQMSPDVTTDDARLQNMTKKLEKFVDALVDHRAASAEQTLASADAIYQSSLTWMAAITVGLVVLAGFISAWVTRRLTRQLGAEPAYAKQIAGRIASGDLTMGIRVPPNDQDSLIYSLSEMQTQLAQTLREIAQSSRQVADASGDITEGNQELSQRTEQQSQALERTAGNVQQLASIARNNAESASEAAALTSRAAQATSTSRDVVSEVAKTMQQISESTRSIQSISGVIEGIAFRTNILALNAAVEAAHAGEHGRGFAVVATEVRDLAQRCASAAREINGLIQGAASKVEVGVELTQKARQAIHDVRDTIQSVATVMSDISDASRQQSQEVEAINQAVSELDHGNQQNATMVKQSVQTAQSLDEQARTLDDLLSRFELSSTT
ncbi:MAG TPA: methyl-accepting chemotaxis protein [Burkholderiaceae bacterium]|nr:methyl-accepting chemotaxis protein [Burkholderiaceae bacterium]